MLRSLILLIPSILCTSIENIEEQIEEEKKRAEELKSEVREWERKNKDDNKKMGGVHMSAQHHVQTLKNVRKLDNNLQLVCDVLCNFLLAHCQSYGT